LPPTGNSVAISYKCFETIELGNIIAGKGTLPVVTELLLGAMIVGRAETACNLPNSSANDG